MALGMSWSGWRIGMLKMCIETPLTEIPRDLIMACSESFVGGSIRVLDQMSESQAEAAWSLIFGMKPLGSVARLPRKRLGDRRGPKKGRSLQKIKIIEDKEDRQNDIDNHSGQNYNIEQFSVFSHSMSSSGKCAKPI